MPLRVVRGMTGLAGFSSRWLAQTLHWGITIGACNVHTARPGCD